MYTTQVKKTPLDNQPLINFRKQNLGGTPTPSIPSSSTSQKQNFLNQSRSQATPKSSLSQTPPAKSLNIDRDQYCRSKFTVFGQITFPIIIIILLLIIAVVVVFFSVRYYKSKVLLANSSLISKPTNLSDTLSVPNSQNSPSMNSNDFSYLFWLFINPPTNISNKNVLVFIRDSSDTNIPTFCVYLSNNAGTLNVASLLSSDTSTLNDTQRGYIRNLQFDLLPNFYLISSTNQISFYKWFFVSVIGSQNQLQLFITAIAYDTQINIQNHALQKHSNTIDIGHTNNKYSVLTDSYISKLIVYNYPVNQTVMQKVLKYGPQ